MYTTSNYVSLKVCSKTLLHKPLPLIQILMPRKAKEVLEISQICLIAR